MNTEEISEFKQKLAVEIIARFPMLQGRNGRISEMRKKDFVDGALWAIEQVQIKEREAAENVFEKFFGVKKEDENIMYFLNIHHPVK